MKASLEDLLRLAFAPSTRATYAAGISRFKQFCLLHRMPALPADKETIIYFTVSMSRALSPATIKVYLSAISSWHQQNGYKSPTSHNPMLNLIVKGARKQHALKSNHKSTRQPITAKILKHMLQEVRKPSYYLCQHDKRMLAAAFTLAFFGLLRISEFTVPSKLSFNPRKHASITSIKWKEDHFIFTIKSSKTDQLRYGQALYITRSRSEICPFAAMRRYFHSRGLNKSLKHAPLFSFKNGQPLTRHSCLKHMRSILAAAGYQPLTFNTHSFRIGAATTAAQAGIPTSQIKLLGRWHSSAYQRYTRTGKKALKSAASSLATIASK